MEQLRALLLVGTGGAAGSCLRYLTGVWLDRVAPGRFPWGTLVVNLVGSIVLVILMVWLDGLASGSEKVRLAIGVGLLGGFTTYSTFNLEILNLVREGEVMMAWLYMSVTIVGALVAGFAAIWMVR